MADTPVLTGCPEKGILVSAFATSFATWPAIAPGCRRGAGKCPLFSKRWTD
ncbi:hypothetical protein Z945_1557 [Sulfitobacter noctilucae]|nr:hypothetical protein Z945_1557 [Sulfitobacter noctilucae]